MKYPQLVRMPSAVQDWLHEQLEARGIDAVVYTRYVLSLLQRDSIDLADDLFSFPAEKEKESGRRGRKHGRLEEGWDVRDSEQLKRSAAVECLMSASDQKCGIEKLVDELCMKLKEAQEEGTLNSELNQKSSTHTPPSGEQSLEYHTAFPPLQGKFTEQTKALLDSNSVWNNRKILATLSEKSDSLHGGTVFVTSNKRGNIDYESVQVMKSFGLDKEIGFGFALKMAAERNFSCLDLSSGVEGADEMKVFRRNHENSDDITCRRLYQRQAEDEESLYSGMIDENTEEFYRDDDESVETSKQTAEDSNLAQLIAKFDHSIEALWNPDDETPPPSNVVEDPLNCENDLPVDFRRLLSSPEDDSLAMELSDLGHKSHPEELRPRNTFIQCGTNIISSIWSEQPSQDSSIEHENFSSVDYMNSSILEEKNNKNKNLSGQNVKESINTKTNLKSDVQSEVKYDKEKMNIFLKNVGNAAFDNKNQVPVNKLQTFSSLFTSLPWDLNYSIENLKNEVIANKWSNAATQPSAATKKNMPDAASNDTVVNDSYVLLNHNRKDSSFIEVVPKQSGASTVQQWLNACNQYQSQPPDDPNIKDGSAKEEEDLLTSNRTHFRPIRQESIDSRHHHNVGHYADGTTFVIPNKLDDVTFKRSESGSLYLESDGSSGVRRKYMEYKEKEPYGGRHQMDYHMEVRDFIPKFLVRESEKCCQTEDEEDACMSDDEVDTKRSRQEFGESEEFFFPGDDQFARKVIDHFDNGNNHRETRRSVRKALFHIPAKHDSPHNGNPFLQATFMQPGGVFQQTDLTLQCTISQMPSFEWNSSTSQTNCRCGSGSWKNGWLKNYSGIQKGAWHQWDPKKPCSFSHQWYDIWSTEPESSKLCESCASSRAVGAPNDESHFGQHGNCTAPNNTDSMHHEELREELSRDGDQLLHDLSYLRHAFLGPDIPEESVMAAQSKSLFAKEETISSLKVYDEWKSNERPFMAKATPKDRKRRHSATQKEFSLPQEMMGIPCISMDAAHCLKGIVARPFFYGGAHTLRPVTL